MPTMKQFAKARQYYKDGIGNIACAKKCLIYLEEYPDRIEFYSTHLLGHIDNVLFWAKEIKDELGRS